MQPLHQKINYFQYLALDFAIFNTSGFAINVHKAETIENTDSQKPLNQIFTITFDQKSERKKSFCLRAEGARNFLKRYLTSTRNQFCELSKPKKCKL